MTHRQQEVIVLHAKFHDYLRIKQRFNNCGCLVGTMLCKALGSAFNLALSHEEKLSGESS